VCSFAYAAVFAMGAFIGILLEEKLSIRMVIVRVICQHDVSELDKSLQEDQYGVTTHDAEESKTREDYLRSDPPGRPS